MDKMAEWKLEVERVYEEYLMATEGRGMSYGELVYIEGLDEQELDDLYKEANEALDDLEQAESKRKDDNGQA